MSEQVHIRVSEGRRADWSAHAKDDYSEKYGNVSALVRHAVERQIERDTGDAQSTATAESADSERLADVHDVVTDNHSTLEDVTTELRRLREDVQATTGVSDQVVSDVYAALPSSRLSSDTGFIEGGTTGVTPAEVAEAADVSEDDAEVALAQLRREFPNVRMLMTSEMDDPVYWREED